MDAFIKTAARDLALDEGATRDAVVEVLIVLRGRSEPVDFGRLLTAVPGAAEMLAAKFQPSPTKGVAGQLQKAASLLGSRPGGTLDATTLARKSGLTSDSVGPLVARFLDFLEQKCGPELFARIRQRAPELEALSRRS